MRITRSTGKFEWAFPAFRIKQELNWFS